MNADYKNVTQDDEGRYYHKSVFFDKNFNALIGTTPIFEEAGGCWSCVTIVHFKQTKFVFHEMHPKHKVLIYLEAA